MKEIEAKDLEVGDVFIDRDRCAVVVSDERVIISGMRFITVRCIVGPSAKAPFLVGPNDIYYLHIACTILLCRGPIL